MLGAKLSRDCLAAACFTGEVEERSSYLAWFLVVSLQDEQLSYYSECSMFSFCDWLAKFRFEHLGSSYCAYRYAPGKHLCTILLFMSTFLSLFRVC